MCCRGDKAPPPYLVPPHENCVLPAQGLDLLVQVHVSLMVPLEHHVARVLEPKNKNKKNAEWVELIVNEFEKMDVKK